MDIRQRSFRIWGAAAFLALATSVVSALHLAHSRQERLEGGMDLAQAQANSAAQRLAAGMQILDHLLIEAAGQVPSDRPPAAGTLEPLRPRLATLPSLRGLGLTDGDGILRQAVQTRRHGLQLPLDLSDRPHFQFQRRHFDQSRMALSPPAEDRLTQGAGWFAARPLIGAGGRFVGVVCASLDLDFLAAPLQAALPDHRDAASLFSTDGMLFASIPAAPQELGRSIANSPLFLAFRRDDQGDGPMMALTGIADRQERIFALAPVPDRPLVVAIGIDRDRVLEGWWREVQIHGGIEAALVCAIALMAWSMLRAERRHLAASERLRLSERRHLESLSQDMAERTAQWQQSLADLQESEERFRLIADTSPLPLGVTRRADSTVIYINAQAAQTFQIAQDQACGKVAPDFWQNPDDRARMVEKLARDGQVRNLEVVLKRANGQGFTALLSGAFGQLRGEAMVLVSVQDISERKRLEEELARSNAELERFSYAISHDLQEPLRMVASYLALVERRYGERLDDEGREFIAFAVDGAKRMARMTSDLLEYSRANRQACAVRPADLNRVMDEALANLASSIAAARARVETEPLPTVVADAGQIMRVLQNLVGNALKYGDPGRPPRIGVAARRQGRFWVISVSDDGRGFLPDQAPFLFQAFRRLAPEGDVGGSGLGLALCRSIVAAHHGEIWAESPGPGQGAVFSFTLPAEETEPSATVAPTPDRM